MSNESLHAIEGRLAVPVNDNDHLRGPADAPVSLVEYGDYQCPYCGMAYPIVEDLLRQRPDTVRYAYRHFPLTNVHPYAELILGVSYLNIAFGTVLPTLYRAREQAGRYLALSLCSMVLMARPSLLSCGRRGRGRRPGERIAPAGPRSVGAATYPDTDPSGSSPT